MGADSRLVTLENADCIHLAWYLDNALQELQITCTFREDDSWLDILGFPDTNGKAVGMSEHGAGQVIRFFNRVNSFARFGCAFCLDPQTYDIACAGRIRYSLLKRSPDHVVDMIEGIWDFMAILAMS